MEREDLALRIRFNENGAIENAPYATVSDLVEHIHNFKDETGYETVLDVTEIVLDAPDAELVTVLDEITALAARAYGIYRDLGELHTQIEDAGKIS